MARKARKARKAPRDEFKEAQAIADNIDNGTPYQAYAEVPGIVWVNTFEGLYAFEGIVDARWSGTFYFGAHTLAACKAGEGERITTRISRDAEPDKVAEGLVYVILKHRKGLPLTL